MRPHLTEIYGPNFLARMTRRVRGRGEETTWVVRVPGPVDRGELVRLLAKRFPLFTVDQEQRAPRS